jgi:hypothetical protein
MPFAPVRTQAVPEGAVPMGTSDASSPAAVVLAMPSAPVSMITVLRFWHSPFSGTSCVSSPAAIVLTTPSMPAADLVLVRGPRPTAAACRSSPPALVSQMPFVPVSTTTSLCSAVPGAMRWRSAHATGTVDVVTRTATRTRDVFRMREHTPRSARSRLLGRVHLACQLIGVALLAAVAGAADPPPLQEQARRLLGADQGPSRSPPTAPSSRR